MIGIEVDGQYVAIPHNILWWHEIVNFNTLGVPLAVTYCPLTGSSMVFDRSGVDGNTFGVSGLLFLNNLIMFNRTAEGTTESLFPQMMRGARCGPLDGQTLTDVSVGRDDVVVVAFAPFRHARGGRGLGQRP